MPAATYLDEASRMLDGVPAKVQKDAAKPLDDLRKHFTELNKDYREQRDKVGPSLTRTDLATDIPTWRDSFADVERDLAQLVGGGSTLEATTPGNVMLTAPTTSPAAAAAATPVGTTGQTNTGVATQPNPSAAVPSVPAPAGVPAGQPAGTTQTTTPGVAAPNQPAGTTPATPGATAPAATTPAPAATDTLSVAGSLAAAKVSVIGIKDLDPSVRTQLEQFRLQLELFYSSTGNLQ